MSDLSVYASSFISLYSRNVWYLLSPLHDVRRQLSYSQSSFLFFIALFLVFSDMRYVRKVKLAFIVSTFSDLLIFYSLYSSHSIPA